MREERKLTDDVLVVEGHGYLGWVMFYVMLFILM